VDLEIRGGVPVGGEVQAFEERTHPQPWSGGCRRGDGIWIRGFRRRRPEEGRHGGGGKGSERDGEQGERAAHGAPPPLGTHEPPAGSSGYFTSRRRCGWPRTRRPRADSRRGAWPSRRRIRKP